MTEHTPEAQAAYQKATALLANHQKVATCDRAAGKSIERMVNAEAAIGILANVILAAGRASMVETVTTDEVVERLARTFFARSHEGRNGFSWPLNPGDRERDLRMARDALYRILGVARPDREEGKDA